MAHHRRFSLLFLISGLFGAIASAMVSAAYSVAGFTRSFGSLIEWPTFKPEASASLALDRMARFGVSLSLPALAARFKSFRDRAMRHEHFDGEHFDPGRMPA